MKANLSKEEKHLEDKIFSDKWPSVGEKNLSDYRKSASNHLKKDARLNIRISSADLKLIKDRAAEEGLPYQSLVSSLIHKYASNELLDRRQIKAIVSELKASF